MPSQDVSVPLGSSHSRVRDGHVQYLHSDCDSVVASAHVFLVMMLLRKKERKGVLALNFQSQGTRKPRTSSSADPARTPMPANLGRLRFNNLLRNRASIEENTSPLTNTQKTMNVLRQGWDNITNPKHTRWIAPLQILGDAALCVAVVYFVPCKFFPSFQRKEGRWLLFAITHKNPMNFSPFLCISNTSNPHKG